MAPRRRETFPKSARLRKRREFVGLSRAGRKQQSAHFVVIQRPNERGRSRLGVTVSGKVGNAVARNRIKRRVREFFRRQFQCATAPCDLLVIAKNGAAELAGKRLGEELERALLARRERIHE